MDEVPRFIRTLVITALSRLAILFLVIYIVLHFGFDEGIPAGYNPLWVLGVSLSIALSVRLALQLLLYSLLIYYIMTRVIKTAIMTAPLGVIRKPGVLLDVIEVLKDVDLPDDRVCDVKLIILGDKMHLPMSIKEVQ